jgi:signal peptidase I
MNFDFSLLLVILTAISGAVIIVDYFLFAKGRKARNAELKEGEKEEKPGWATEQAIAFFPVLALVLCVRSFWFEPFKIPSGSMIPTMLIGDFIVVNKYAYGVRLPVLNKTIIPVGSPKRGDVVIFKRPMRNGTIQDEHTGQTFVKRCVGIPGDTIEWRGNELSVNGQLVAKQSVGPYTGEFASVQNIGTQLFKEDLTGAEHQVLNLPFSTLDGSWTVPTGQYFMVGDNRGNSSDSRDWGFVPEENLMGRASFVWFHWDWDRPGKVAWNRIGTKVK